MRAYVYKASPYDGLAMCGTGTITKSYKTKKNLLRYGVNPLRRVGTSLRIEIHYNWETRFKEAYEIVII